VLIVVDGSWETHINVGSLGRVGTECPVMRNRIEIDYSHSRAIVQEIGERLQASLKEDRELRASLRMQIDRLRRLEGPSHDSE
jgi:hypothetical protein